MLMDICYYEIGKKSFDIYLLVVCLQTLNDLQHIKLSHCTIIYYSFCLVALDIMLNTQMDKIPFEKVFLRSFYYFSVQLHLVPYT